MASDFADRKDGHRMKRAEADTINIFSKRSDRAVIYITMAFALGGAFADLLSHLRRDAGVGMLWGLWIPLCFVTIPPIHYLCRQVVSLRERLEALERHAGPGSAAG
jgi:hypothetical protein